MDELDEVKRSVDIVTLLTGYGVELKKRGHEYSCKCIWHDDNTPSMSVFQGDDGIWKIYCHGVCGKVGSVLDVVMEFEQCNLTDAKKRLKANYTVVQ